MYCRNSLLTSFYFLYLIFDCIQMHLHLQAPWSSFCSLKDNTFGHVWWTPQSKLTSLEQISLVRIQTCSTSNFYHWLFMVAFLIPFPQQKKEIILFITNLKLLAAPKVKLWHLWYLSTLTLFLIFGFLYHLFPETSTISLNWLSSLCSSQPCRL